MVARKEHAKIAMELESVNTMSRSALVVIVGPSARHAAEWWVITKRGAVIANLSHLAGPGSKRRSLRQSLGSGRLKDAFQSTLHGIAPIQTAKEKSVARTGPISRGILGIGL